MARIPADSEYEAFDLHKFDLTCPRAIDQSRLDACKPAADFIRELSQQRAAFIADLGKAEGVEVSAAVFGEILDAALGFIHASRMFGNIPKAGRGGYEAKRKKIEDLRSAIKKAKDALRAAPGTSGILGGEAGLPLRWDSSDVADDLEIVLDRTIFGRALARYGFMGLPSENMSRALGDVVARLELYLSNFANRHGLSASRPKNEHLDGFLQQLADAYERAGGMVRISKDGSGDFARFLLKWWHALPLDVTTVTTDSALLQRAYRLFKKSDAKASNSANP